MVRGSLVTLAEAVREVARNERTRKAALELTAAATERVRHLLDARKKVRDGTITCARDLVVCFVTWPVPI